MTSRLESMKQLVVDHYRSAIDEHDVDAAVAHLSDDFVDHSAPAGTEPGPGPAREWLVMLTSAFPDLQIRAEDLVAEGDRVALRATWSGTHTKDFLGVPASGREVTFSGAVFWRVDGDRLAERWSFIDRANLVQQLAASAER